MGKMNMVDLAGSERQSKTGATGDTLKARTMGRGEHRDTEDDGL